MRSYFPTIGKMRYTLVRNLSQVAKWVRLKFAA